jgi:hypothetical protein
LGLTLNAFAAQAPNAKSSSGPSSAPASAIDELRLADSLADYGERNKDPVALIEAAKIRKLLPAPLDAEPDQSLSSRGWQALLERAGQLAAGDPTVKGMIVDVRRLKRRDIPVIPLGIKLLHWKVNQNAADRAEVRFSADELAVVYLRTVPGVPLNLFVYDDLNNLICAGDSTSSGYECRWRPRRDGTYLINVRNDGTTPVDYELAINREPVPR